MSDSIIDESGGDQPVLRFEGLEIDIAGGRVTCGGSEVVLAPQPMRLLVYLAERPGRIVTRTELRTALWPDRHVEFDQALNFAVRQIRRGLGENGHMPQIIEAVPRRGYRFLALPIRDDPQQTVSEVPARRRLVFGALAIVVFGVGLITLLSQGRPPSPGPEKQLVHVSVTAVHGTDVALANAIALRLSDALRRMPTLRVGTNPDSGVGVAIQLDSGTAGPRLIATLHWPGEPRPRWRAVSDVAANGAEQIAHDLAEDIVTAFRGVGGGHRTAGKAETVVVERSNR